jgi:RNA polymerase sigma-70 factor, ECF subfamily
MVEDDERFLVEAAQRDPARFADLYERHFEQIYAYVLNRVRDRDAAEDVTAEVFHKALANLRNYEWRGAPFGAWLVRIAANAATDRAKRMPWEAVDPERMPDHGSDPLDEVQRVDERARLFRLVHELPADQRTVIVERFVEERSTRDIAKRLGKTEGAIKQLQFRALQNLRKWMEGANG